MLKKKHENAHKLNLKAAVYKFAVLKDREVTACKIENNTGTVGWVGHELWP